MMHQAGLWADALDRTAAKLAERDPNGRRLVDDESVAYRFGSQCRADRGRGSARRASSVGWRSHRPCAIFHRS